MSSSQELYNQLSEKVSVLVKVINVDGRIFEKHSRPQNAGGMKLLPRPHLLPRGT